MLGPVECKPSFACPTNDVGAFLDLHVMNYKSLLRMNLDTGTVGTEARAPDPG